MFKSTQRTISRRRFVQGVAGTVLAGPLVNGSCAGQPARGGLPNVLIVFPDQWRRQAFSCAGDPVVRTPNMDRIAAEGVRFERCYTNNPVCSPARATLMTGRYPHQTGVINNDILMRPEEVTIAECLRDAGYATEYIGKWHLDGQARPGFVQPGPRRQGFESFEGFNRGHWYHNAQYFTNDGQLVRPGVFEPTYQTDLAIQFMKRHQDKPFFVFLAWGPPHTPYAPPQGFDRVKPEDLKWRPNVSQEWQANEANKKALCGYYGLCEALDHEMGRLLKFLDESGLAKNTLVLVTADHGDAHGSHGLQHKGHPQEESSGIPLMARLPGVIPAGTVSQTLISLLDLMPSVLSLCGVNIPQTVAGRDLSSAFRGEKVAEAPVYMEGRMQHLRQGQAAGEGAGASYGAWRAIVTSQHKLAVDYTRKVRLLVDLEKDPYEMNNLADRPEAAALQKQLLAQLQEIGKQTGDPFPAEVPKALETTPTGEIIQ